MADIEQPEPTGVSRRTVTKAMAWAVPVVAIASTAPLAAASPICIDSDVCFGGIDIGKFCSANANPRRYWACVTFTNNSNVNVDITFDFNLVTSANGTFVFAGGGQVPANGTACFLVEEATNTNGGEAGNCSNGDYAPFDLDFTDGINSGTVPVPGGSTGGNREPVCVC